MVRKVQRNEEASDASQLAAGSRVSLFGTGDRKRISMAIVAAEDQPLCNAPTQATVELLPFMDYLKDDTSSILPAALQTVQASQHYAFQVAYTNDGDAGINGVVVVSGVVSRVPVAVPELSFDFSNSLRGGWLRGGARAMSSRSRSLSPASPCLRDDDPDLTPGRCNCRLCRPAPALLAPPLDPLHLPSSGVIHAGPDGGQCTYIRPPNLFPLP